MKQLTGNPCILTFKFPVVLITGLKVMCVHLVIPSMAISLDSPLFCVKLSVKSESPKQFATQHQLTHGMAESEKKMNSLRLRFAGAQEMAYCGRDW